MTRPDPITMTAGIDRPRIRRMEKTSMTLSVEVQASEDVLEAARLPVTVVLVVDVSGSMTGPPLEHVRRSAQMIAEVLRPTDQLGIVTFSSRAASVAPLRELDTVHRSGVFDAIRNLRTQANTNIEAGLRQAKKALRRARVPTGRGAVVLLSDGQPNAGKTTPEKLGRLAAKIRPEATISTLGYGAHHDERVLVAIAEGGGGGYAYIPDPLVAATKIARAVGAAGETVADEVSLAVSPAIDTAIVRILGGGAVRHTSDGPRIALPTLHRGRRHTIALELEVQARREPGRCEIASLDLAYRLPSRGVIDHLARNVEVDVAHDAGPLDPRWHRSYLLALCDIVRTKARDLADRGNFAAAARQLQDTIDRIDAAPGFVADDGTPLAEAREQLVDDRTTMEAAPDPEHLAAIYRGQHGRFSEGHGEATAERVGIGRALEAYTAGTVPPARLVDLSEPKQPHRLGARNVVGRSRTCDIVVPSAQVSRQHLGIFVQDGRFVVEDYGSANGIWVNGYRTTVKELAHGDVIEVGDHRFSFEEGSE